MNPYEILGLKPDASTGQIRASYRHLAKGAHPDSGGDVEAFARLKLAHDILIDPQRRAKFDATGEVDAPQPDNSLSQAMQVISVVMQQVLTGDQDPLAADVLDAMRRHIEGERNAILGNRSKARRAIDRIDGLVGRFVFTGEGEDHPMAAVLRNQRLILDQHMRVFDAQAKAHQDALKLLEDYRYDMPRPQMMQAHMLNQMFTSTTFTTAR